MWEKGAKVRHSKSGRVGTVTRRGMQRALVSYVGGGETLTPIGKLDRIPADTCMNSVRRIRT